MYNILNKSEMYLCFEKLLKFEICLKIRILLKYLKKNIIKTVPKIFNEIYQTFVQVYNS